jgi:uncharacterized protein (TIGR02594 family)
MLPAAYQWLEKEPGPPILLEALALYGTREAPSSVNNPVILDWAQEVGASRLGLKYTADEVPWCGLFMAVCCQRAHMAPPAIAVRALAWAGWGLPSDKPMLGDVLTFQRPGGGHVGLYVGEDEKAFHVLGGNQADSVSFSRIERSRLYSASRTPWKGPAPANIRLVRLARTGSLSSNEA